MRCWYSNGSLVASSMIAWMNGFGGLWGCVLCSICEYWEMASGLQIQRLYRLGDWGAVMTGMNTVIVIWVWVGVTIGLSGRSGHAVGSSGNDVGGRAVFGACLNCFHCVVKDWWVILECLLQILSRSHNAVSWWHMWSLDAVVLKSNGVGAAFCTNDGDYCLVTSIWCIRGLT